MNKENTDALLNDIFRKQQIRVAVDAVCIAQKDTRKYILLIKREYEPFKNCWALPGGFVRGNENLEESVIRELKEETNIDAHIDKDNLTQIGAYGNIGRDPRPTRVISIAYLFKFDDLLPVHFANESLEVEWVEIEKLKKDQLAFDHINIINDALTL